MAKLTESQIKQIIGQLESSIDKIEPHLDSEEFKDYCDATYTSITYWRGVIKKLNILDASS